MKTKAAVLRNVGGPLTVEELEVPELKSGQVLVKIICAGLCQTQLNEIRGYYATQYIPHLMGHEASAKVVDIADDVKKVRRDDYVAVSWIQGEGLSFHSLAYRKGKEEINAGACAIFSELAVVAENRVVKIPPEMPPEPAALLGCAISTGMGIVDNLGNVEGKRIVVFGVGGVGAAALMRAKSLGAVCTAVDVKDWKLCWARKTLKADATANPKNDKLENFDVAIESSGSKSAMDMAFEAINYKGIAVIAGNVMPGQKVCVDPYDLMKGKTIKGSWGGGVFPDKAIPFYANLHLEGKININKLIGDFYEFQFEDIKRGFEDLAAGELIRGIFRF